jgi:hypothetical protein
MVLTTCNRACTFALLKRGVGIIGIFGILLAAAVIAGRYGGRFGFSGWDTYGASNHVREWPYSECVTVMQEYPVTIVTYTPHY